MSHVSFLVLKEMFWSLKPHQRLFLQNKSTLYILLCWIKNDLQQQFKEVSFD